MSLRTKWYRTIAIAVAWEQKAWADDRKFTVEDIDETLWAIAGLGLVWKGDIILASVPGLAIVEGIVITGAVASFAIGGVRGVENYIDFITTPSKYYERTEESAQTFYEHMIEKPLVSAAKLYVGSVDRFISYSQRQIDATRKLITEYDFGFRTGPYLPF